MAVLYYEMAANHAVEEIKRRKVLFRQGMCREGGMKERLLIGD